ncbi:MAG: helix-turn-helix transcriptional regulator [Clostridia bacterium]|nr:helix-turn-helix transcriptional regulator [Clostridia bacterium]
MDILENEQLRYAQNQINLEILQISYGLLDPLWNFRDLHSSFTRVYIPLCGEASVTVKGERIPLIPGNIYLLPAGLPFSCSCPNSMKKIFVHLLLKRPDGSDLLASVGQCVVLKDREEEVEQIRQYYERLDMAAVLSLKRILYGIAEQALLTADAAKAEIRPYSECTKAALAYIQEHLCASLSIDEIANALFRSKISLQKHFRKDMGKPIGRYIDDCIIAAAERELLKQKLSVKEISDRLGFCDQFYFSRKFSKVHGIGPSRFRKIHQI